MPDWEQLARRAAAAAGIDEDLFARQIRAESNFNPRAKSSAGALGIAQIMPETAAGWGVDPMNPRAALGAAASNMSRYIDSYGGWRGALTAYNAGPGRVGKPLYPETASYIQKILGDSGPRGTGQSSPQPAPAASGSSAFDFVMAGSPFAGMGPAPAPAPAPSPQMPDPSRYVAPDRGKATAGGWRDLQKIAQQKFGLRNDPGDSQTTGGRHTAGSEHYGGRAIDFGDARNSWDKLNAWASWARSHGYDVLNEGDHIHVSLPGGVT